DYGGDDYLRRQRRDADPVAGRFDLQDRDGRPGPRAAPGSAALVGLRRRRGRADAVAGPEVPPPPLGAARRPRRAAAMAVLGAGRRRVRAWGTAGRSARLVRHPPGERGPGLVLPRL